jgi:hypothetical protein
MKKFIYIMVAFMLMLILSGCATTAEQRKELYNQRDTVDLKNEVGNSQFVGAGGLDANGLMYRPLTSY